MNFRLLCVAVCLSIFSFLFQPSSAQTAPSSLSKQDARYYGSLISQQLSMPEESVDYGALALAFNAMVDPTLDIKSADKTLNKMVSDIKAIAGENASEKELLSSLRRYVYEAGEWNNNKSFAYDHDDPLGTHLPNKLIPNYLKSRKGNCVSMPTLVLILGQRLGLDMTLSTAPNHVFVHYRDPQGRVLRLETTDGAHPMRTEWLKKNFPISDKSVETGLYLKVLSKRQTAAVLAGLVLEAHKKQKAWGYAVHTSEALLNVYPEYDLALIGRGLAFQSMLQDEFLSKYPNPQQIPREQWGLFNHLAKNADDSFNKVEALGYIGSAPPN